MKTLPVILAGGNGYRVWPMSQKINPKQFVKYFDNLSSFQNTIIRNAHLGIPLIVANIIHKNIIYEQLEEINARAKIIFEPVQKNTAICAILATYYAKAQGYDTVILIPSDHYIDCQTKYDDSLIKGINATEEYKFSVIGISPTCDNSNFGYIKADEYIDSDLYLASKFIEKPSAELLATFENMSEYFWNSGIYFFNIAFILRLANQFIPEISDLLSLVFSPKLLDKDVIELEPILYDNLPSISFDNAISVNLDNMALIKANFEWSDLGNWETLWKMKQKNEDKNNIQGKVITHNVTNSYISSDAINTLAINLKDTIVVLKDGQLLIANKNGTELIKDILTKMETI